VNAEIFKKGVAPIIVLAAQSAPAKRIARLRAVVDEVKICGRTTVDLRAAARWLRENWNVKRLLCEGGAELNDAMFRAGLIDEIHLTICPKIFGGRQAPTIADGIGFSKLALARNFAVYSIRSKEGELFTVFRRAGRPAFVANP
jgi:riboflavin biosynthesis pyrimidine reductase